MPATQIHFNFGMSPNLPQASPEGVSARAEAKVSTPSKQQEQVSAVGGISPLVFDDAPNETDNGPTSPIGIGTSPMTRVSVA